MKILEQPAFVLFFSRRIENAGVGESDNDAGADSDDEDAVHNRGLGGVMMSLWLKRKPLLDSDYAMAAWMLCVQPDVMEDVAIRGARADERLAMERVIEKLHYPPCPNKSKELRGKTITQIIDLFWDEFQTFTKRLAPFNRPGRFLTDGANQGRSYTWHQKYSLPYTEVLRFVACRVCSKVLGIGMAERAWGDLTRIKDGRRAGMGGDSTEMRSIIYTSARLTHKRAQQVENDRIGLNANNMFGEDNMK